MAHEPIPVATLAAFLPLVAPHRNWSTKRELVSTIGSYEGGVWFNAPDAAEWLGLSASRCRQLLADLERDRVILRDSGDGGRVFWCEVNPDLTAWRVPWRVTPRRLRERLVWHAEQVMIGPGERLIARPMWRRCPDVIARLIGARSDLTGGASSRANGPRDDGGGAEAHRAHKGARSRGVPRIVQEQAMRSVGGPGGVPTSARGFDSRPPHAAGDAGEEERSRVTAGEFERARRAVLARTITASGGRRFINGAPKDRLLELIAAHGIEAVVIGTERVPVETYLVPHFIDALADVLEGDGDEVPAIVADERRANLEQRKRSLLNQREVFQRAGVDEDDTMLADIDQEVADIDRQLVDLDDRTVAL